VLLITLEYRSLYDLIMVQNSKGTLKRCYLNTQLITFGLLSIIRKPMVRLNVMLKL
jgi:hypothetical protein